MDEAELLSTMLGFRGSVHEVDTQHVIGVKNEDTSNQYAEVRRAGNWETSKVQSQSRIASRYDGNSARCRTDKRNNKKELK